MCLLGLPKTLRDEAIPRKKIKIGRKKITLPGESFPVSFHHKPEERENKKQQQQQRLYRKLQKSYRQCKDHRSQHSQTTYNEDRGNKKKWAPYQ